MVSGVRTFIIKKKNPSVIEKEPLSFLILRLLTKKEAIKNPNHTQP